MPGNHERLQDYFGRMSSPLLLTLGVEVAALVRGESYATVNRHKKETFYADPVEMEVFGTGCRVVHLVHPGLLMSRRPQVEGWRNRHRDWCAGFRA
jgi:hypothetical protein